MTRNEVISALKGAIEEIHAKRAAWLDDADTDDNDDDHEEEGDGCRRPPSMRSAVTSFRHVVFCADGDNYNSNEELAVAVEPHLPRGWVDRYDFFDPHYETPICRWLWVVAEEAEPEKESSPCPICGPQHRGSMRSVAGGPLEPVETTLAEELAWAQSAAAAEAQERRRLQDELARLHANAHTAIRDAWRSGYLAAQEDARTGEASGSLDCDPAEFLLEAADAASKETP